MPDTPLTPNRASTPDIALNITQVLWEERIALAGRPLPSEAKDAPERHITELDKNFADLDAGCSIRITAGLCACRAAESEAPPLRWASCSVWRSTARRRSGMPRRANRCSNNSIICRQCPAEAMSEAGFRRGCFRNARLAGGQRRPETTQWPHRRAR